MRPFPVVYPPDFPLCAIAQIQCEFSDEKEPWNLRYTVSEQRLHRRNRRERTEWTEPQPQSYDSAATLKLHNSPLASRQRDLSWQNEGRMPASGNSDGLCANLIAAVIPNRRRDVGS